ncbi:MAG: protein kinase domain-containing protein [Gemmatimonadales bacterium]
MFCSRCGSEVSSKSKFCPSCGLDLTATTPVHAVAAGSVAELDLVREALDSEYEILEELGRGGMALVFRAKDKHLEREVAVKVLPFSLAFDAEFVERFQREARTAAQLEHPSIIPIYRVGRSGRVIYFVMKFLRGGSLSTVLAERRTLSPSEIRRLLLEAGSALGYAAQRGIVHRDIKPDNIMFDEFGQSMLTDFGIAKAASGQRLTGTGMSIGTPHYMSPEQARAQAIDGRSDIYSLGVVAYQCLTGTVPYDGEDSFSIGYKHITEPIPTPQLITADERRLFEVIKRMLMKDPMDRFQACEELIASLRGQPVAAPGTIRAAAPGVTPPAITSQPTTPINSPSVDRRLASDRRDPVRRVADRSVAMRRKPMPAWPWAVIAIVGGGAGAVYYYQARGFAPHAAAAADSTAPAPLDSTSQPAVLGAGGAPGPGDTAGAIPRPLDPSPPPTRPVANPAPAPPPMPPLDSGGIRLVNLPRGSSVLINERPVTDPVTRLPPGAHIVAISAPRFQFHAETVRVEPGQVLELSPVLTPLGMGQRSQRQLAQRAPSCAPGPGYNADRSCFDERPRPVAPPFVPVPMDVEGEPTPSVLWVRVSTDGKTLEVRAFRPSNDGAFERDVRAFAMDLAWQPATKGGAPVEAWTQMIFRPAP